MTEKPVISDQDLSAYLDGEVPAGVAKAIENSLAQDAALKARLSELEAGQSHFTSVMQAALEAAPDMPPLPSARPEPAASTWRVALAGVAVGAIAALGLTWGLWRAPDDTWRDVVANYQSLYVTETLSPVDLSPEAQLADLQRVSKELGIDLTALPDVAGLTFKRAQQLGYKGKPLAQLTYLAADGGPVALCILRTGAETSPDIASDVLSGLDSYSWTDNGFGVLLVGPQGADGLKDAAETFRAALRKAPV